jgi:hypothetical protein
MGFLDDVVSGTGRVLSGIASVAAPAVKLLPGFGPPVAAAMTAYSAVASGGSVSTGGGDSGDYYYGPASAGGDLRAKAGAFLSGSFFGVPMWLVIPAGVGLILLARRRSGRRAR